MIDIIELAKKAGLTKGYIGMSGVSIDASSIEYFAALYKQALIDSGELVPAKHHYHVNSGDGTDACKECGFDLRNPIHHRSAS